MNTTEQPASSAGMILPTAMPIGPFQGAMAATTPMGSRTTSAGAPCRRTSSSEVVRARSLRNLIVSTARLTVAVDMVSGAPISEVINRATSAPRAARPVAAVSITAARAAASSLRHGPVENDWRAALTAASTSAAVASPAWSMTFSVDGHTTSKRSPADGCHAPSMKIPWDTCAPAFCEPGYFSTWISKTCQKCRRTSSRRARHRRAGHH